MAWTQAYDPLHSWILSTLVAALPILVLFGLLAGLRVKPHWCAMAGAGTAVVVAVTVFGMPLSLAGMSFVYGVGFGVLKIAWIVLAAVYLYDVSVFTGQFEIMRSRWRGSQLTGVCKCCSWRSASAPSSKAQRDSALRWRSPAPS